MGWSYSGNPGASDLDQARFYCQDTDEARQLLSDEEFSFLLEQWRPAYNSPLYVAGVACEIIAAKFADNVNVSGDGINVDQGSLQDKYNKLADSLRDQYKALYGMAAPDISNLIADFPDPTIIPLSFGVGFQDNAWAGNQDWGSLRGPGHIAEMFPEQLW